MTTTRTPTEKRAAQLRKQVGEYLAGPFGDLIRGAEIRGYLVDGTWHGEGYCAGGEPTRMKVEDLARDAVSVCDRYRCPQLLLMDLNRRQLHWRRHGLTPNQADWLIEAREHHELARAARLLEKPLKSRTASSIERRRAAAERLITSCEQHTSHGGERVSVYEDLRRRGEKVLEELNRNTGGADHQEKVLTWVRRDLLPKQLAHLDPKGFTLDESPTIVGITPYLPRLHNQKVRALVETFAVRNSDHTVVLVVPRYVYDHLQRSKIGNLSGNVLMQGMPAPADHRVAETAAGLWDPEGTAELASLADAITAAEILTD